VARSRALETGQRVEGVVRSGWVYCGRELLKDAAVRVENGRLRAIVPSGALNRDDEILADYPDALLHPGLVNAHAHLDLTGETVPHLPGTSFTTWLEAVRALRLERSEACLHAAVEQGIEELVRGGATCVVDSSADAISQEALCRSGLDGAVLRELIGLAPDRCGAIMTEAGEWSDLKFDGELRDDVGVAARVQRGLAPHAPYSASPELLCASHEWGKDRLFSIHVAEDPEERDFLEHGTGPFREFLERLGIPEIVFPPTGKSSIDYLEDLGVLDRFTLLVHANDVSPEEIQTIARRGCAVVFCPGTHRHFDRPLHPLEDLLAADVPVALGTDSSASNDALSIRNEMRHVRELFPNLPARTIVDLGTAASLSDLLPGLGSLRVDEPANFAITRVEGEDPLEALVRESGPCALTVARGRALWRGA
jgi:cytosine/adenosine deaminase-related metal-dependent hydrolase